MALYAKIDVALARDPRMIAAGPLGRLLYVQTILYCRENLTDGSVDKLVLPLIAIDIPSPAKHMRRLTELGALEQTGVGWQIPEAVWRRYNPMRSEVDDIRRADAERKKSYRDRARTNGRVPVGQTEVS
jgi:hypothetical protein